VYAWNRDHVGLGLTLPLGPSEGLNIGLGGIVVNRTDELVGTKLNFLVRGSYCWKPVCISFAHVSHGARVFGIAKDEANAGLNFLYLEYRFK